MKFVPLTAKANAASPAIALVGRMPVSVGIGLLTVSTLVFEIPPPGRGLKTVIAGVPAVATSAAVSCAVTCVVLTKLVVRSLPLKRTTEPLIKFMPLTVSENAASPAILLAGKRLEMNGKGLLTVKVLGADGPPPGAGLKTVIGNEPGATTSAVVIWAANWEPLIKVVGRSMLLKRT